MFGKLELGLGLGLGDPQNAVETMRGIGMLGSCSLGSP